MNGTVHTVDRAVGPHSDGVTLDLHGSNLDWSNWPIVYVCRFQKTALHWFKLGKLSVQTNEQKPRERTKICEIS